MKHYPVGVDVALSVPLTDPNGAALTPTGLSYAVKDEAGEIIAGPIALSAPYTSPVAITIPASLNNAAGGRLVELSIITAAGTYVGQAIYGLRASSRLVLFQNTLQTLLQAELRADSMPNLDDWHAAANTEKETVLVEAFRRLTRLSFLVPDPHAFDPDWQSRISLGSHRRLVSSMWPLMTPELWDDYPAHFHDAIMNAQVAEANDILSSADKLDAIELKRRAGLMSESVGESSMMFRSGVRGLDTAVCRRSMEYLTGFLDNRYTLTRS